MNSSDSSSQNSGLPHSLKHTLWQPKATDADAPEPSWHLRVSVLNDGEGMGDCPSRKFLFKSLHHLTHATNQLDDAFSKKFEMKKCGLGMGDAMGDRVNDGRTENVTIEFNSEIAEHGDWKSFLGSLKRLEDEWDHEA